MSEPDLAELEAPVGTYVSEMHTSRMAVVAAFCALGCMLPGTGLLGAIFGLIGLNQINGSGGKLGGASLAWLGIVGGVLSTLGWAVVAQRYVELSHAVDGPTAAFMKAWQTSEADGEAAAAPGLKPLMRAGTGELMRKALLTRFGGFEGLGPRSHFDYRPSLSGETISATYPLRFRNGAPCSATFEYARNAGQLRVAGISLASPLLRDLVLEGHSALHGQATPDLREFGGGKDDLVGSDGVKSFSP